MNNNYSHYYHNHSQYNKIETILDKKKILEYELNIWSFFRWIHSDIRVLEIGSGVGTFAMYCKKMNVKSYIWFDMDSEIVSVTQKNIPEYEFSDKDIFMYLQENKKTFDIVYMSHVFEHITNDKTHELATGIFESLKANWVWINIMPNAGSLFSAPFARYNDITHVSLYTYNSFNQILLPAWFLNENIHHKNAVIVGPIYLLIPHYIAISIMRIWVRLCGYYMWWPDTWEIYSFIYKKYR